MAVSHHNATRFNEKSIHHAHGRNCLRHWIPCRTVSRPEDQTRLQAPSGDFTATPPIGLVTGSATVVVVYRLAADHPYKLRDGTFRSMNTGSVGLERAARRRSQDPRSVPWAVAGELDVVVVDTTWGELQPLHCAPNVRTVGELEVLELIQQGAVLIDTRVSGSSSGVTLPGARSLPHDQAVQRRGELDSSRVSILFCNGPQCPQSPWAIRALLEAGLSADSLAYYRGGVHDWVTLAMPTEATA